MCVSMYVTESDMKLIVLLKMLLFFDSKTANDKMNRTKLD